MSKPPPPPPRQPMTKEQHRARHVELHQALDVLVADYLLHNCLPGGPGPVKLPSNTTVLELMQWSHQQTIDPTEEPTFSNVVTSAPLTAEPLKAVARKLEFESSDIGAAARRRAQKRTARRA